MSPDELGTPLGSARKRGIRGSVPALPLIAAALALVLVTGVLWMLFAEDPLGGEPRVSVPIHEPKAKEAPQPPVKAAAAASAESGGAQPAASTVTIIDGKSGARTEVPVRAGEAGAPAASGPLDPRVAEHSRHGLIPRVGPDGVRPLDVFAGKDSGRDGPRVAIVFTGLGVGANATDEAVAKLPPGMTLAFAPYGPDLPRWTARARSAGHEILLQLPMEPFDYPDNDPGPRALLTSLPADQNVDRLHWFLSRTQGYVGVTTLMGARFITSEAALGPVIADLAKRGLLYFDAGAAPRSVTQGVAAKTKIPFLKADLVVDTKPAWSEIDAALERLERLATQRGFAVGTASAAPVSIERIARWVKAAEARGIRVVPISAIAARAKQS